jgi:hypothetical protein
MRRSLSVQIWIPVLLAQFVAGAATAQLDVVFTPSTRADTYDAGVYREIWAEYGQRLINAIEARSCMPFSEPMVAATVADATSNSGGPDHPMRLRRTYIRSEKQSTLAHELGHRHLWQLEKRLDDIDGHMTLYLILYRVWADVWGEEFAEERVRGESGWDEDYANAWDWARSLAPNEREQLWRQLLVMNDFPYRCEAG